SFNRVFRTLRTAISAPENNPLAMRSPTTISNDEPMPARSIPDMLRRMSTRDRPPPAARSRYITPDGARKVRAELDQVCTRERPRVTQEVADAAAQGDRSENAEYIYGKRRLREIDRRVRFLSKRLDEVTVVNEPPSDPKRVFFGAHVTVETDDGQEKTYRIVGADESDLERGCISIDSP